MVKKMLSVFYILSLSPPKKEADALDAVLLDLQKGFSSF